MKKPSLPTRRKTPHPNRPVPCSHRLPAMGSPAESSVWPWIDPVPLRWMVTSRVVAEGTSVVIAPWSMLPIAFAVRFAVPAGSFVNANWPCSSVVVEKVPPPVPPTCTVTIESGATDSSGLRTWPVRPPELRRLTSMITSAASPERMPLPEPLRKPLGRAAFTKTAPSGTPCTR
jgi:hypothetical protein